MEREPADAGPPPQVELRSPLCWANRHTHPGLIYSGNGQCADAQGAHERAALRVVDHPAHATLGAQGSAGRLEHELGALLHHHPPRRASLQELPIERNPAVIGVVQCHGEQDSEPAEQAAEAPPGQRGRDGRERLRKEGRMHEPGEGREDAHDEHRDHGQEHPCGAGLHGSRVGHGAPATQGAAYSGRLSTSPSLRPERTSA